jgi:hypothetical protein
MKLSILSVDPRDDCRGSTIRFGRTRNSNPAVVGYEGSAPGTALCCRPAYLRRAVLTGAFTRSVLCKTNTVCGHTIDLPMLNSSALKGQKVLYNCHFVSALFHRFYAKEGATVSGSCPSAHGHVRVRHAHHHQCCRRDSKLRPNIWTYIKEG